MIRLFRTFLLSLLLGLLVTGFSACSGFHLRGTHSMTLTPIQGERVWLNGLDIQTGFGKALAQAIKTGGGQLSSDQNVASLSLNILSVNTDKTVSAYSTSRQVREFNHFTEVSFSATLLPASETIPPLEANLRTERIQVYDNAFVLGLAEEERTIRQDLQAEAARLVVLRLQALKNKP